MSDDKNMKFKQLTPGKLMRSPGPAVGQNPTSAKHGKDEFYMAKAPSLGKAYGSTQESAVLALCLPKGVSSPEIKDQYGSSFRRWNGREWEKHEVRAHARFLPDGESMDYSTSSSIEEVAMRHAEQFEKEGQIEVTWDGNEDTYHVTVYATTTYEVDSVEKIDG